MSQFLKQDMHNIHKREYIARDGVKEKRRVLATEYYAKNKSVIAIKRAERDKINKEREARRIELARLKACDYIQNYSHMF
jgi:hypothetical protein